jgi:2-phosphosulfolactate phosphatase
MNVDVPALEVLFTPADFASLAGRDLSNTACVVFDILRATSTIVTALGNGAAAVIPVAEIPEALEWRRKEPSVLLAGERNGLRIDASQTGGVEFDLGNSPREFTADHVAGRTIVLSTTNGSRALRACARAKVVLAACFLNLDATARHLQAHPAETILLICSGTFDQTAYEDVLAAGALAATIWPSSNRYAADSATIARQIYEQSASDLPAAIALSRNGRRLLAQPELRDDVAFCLQRDTMPLFARMDDGKISGIAQ